MTHAYNPRGEWTQHHLMSVAGKFDDITADDLKQVAARFNIRNPAGLIDQVNAAIARWAEFADQAQLPKQDSEEVKSLLIHL